MITAPKWAAGAVPTLRGWERNGELLISRRHTQAQLDEFFGVKPKKKKAPKKKVNENVETKATMLTEAPANNKSISEMTAPEVQTIENQYGVKVDETENLTLTERTQTSE